MPVIAYTTEDPAGSNVARMLLQAAPFGERPPIVERGLTLRNWEWGETKLIELSTRLAKESEYASTLECFKTDLVIFASRHKAESGRPSLTVHSTGNWSESAEWGGRPRELGATSARAIACAYRWLRANALEGFEVSLEATHHGPTSLSSPCVFVELGSTEKEWGMREPAAHLAKCILHTSNRYSQEKGSVALGLGGTHYASKFNFPEEGESCFSFIAARRSLAALDADLVKQAVEKTAEKVECAAIDWKGTNHAEREKIKAILEQLNLEWRRV